MDTLIFGTISASVLLMASISFSMTLKTDGFVNIAHGQMLLFSAYLALGAIAGTRMTSHDLPPARAIQMGCEPFMTVHEMTIVVLAVLSALGGTLRMSCPARAILEAPNFRELFLGV